MSFRHAGCPIRKSADQRSFAPTRGLSQLITSFIASVSQGIHLAPFSTFSVDSLTYKGKAAAHTFSCFFNYIDHSMLQSCLVAICQRSLYIISVQSREYKKPRGMKTSPTVPAKSRHNTNLIRRPLQKGGVPAAPSGTATLLRLSPNHQFHLRPPLAVTDFRCPRLSWLDGRCVQGPGTYSPRHG